VRRLTALLVVPALACSRASGGDGAGDGGKGGSCGEGSAGASSGPPLVPDASCPEFAACGGELEGTWDVREACVTREQAVTAPIVESCPDSAAANLALEASGSYVFSSGLLEADFTLAGTVTVAFTADCARTLCTDLSSLCADYEASQAGDPQYASATCSVVDDECRCTLVGMPSRREVVTSYEVEGFRIVSAGGGETEFCVSGSELATRYADADDLVFVGLERR